MIPFYKTVPEIHGNTYRTRISPTTHEISFIIIVIERQLGIRHLVNIPLVIHLKSLVQTIGISCKISAIRRKTITITRHDIITELSREHKRESQPFPAKHITETQRAFRFCCPQIVSPIIVIKRLPFPRSHKIHHMRRFFIHPDIQRPRLLPRQCIITAFRNRVKRFSPGINKATRMHRHSRHAGGPRLTSRHTRNTVRCAQFQLVYPRRPLHEPLV